MTEADPDALAGELAERFLSISPGFFRLPGGVDRKEAYDNLQKECRNLIQPISIHASSGLPVLWLALGEANLNGWGVEKNERLGMYWLSKAAEGGHADAMVKLALSLRPHDAAQAEQKEAISWYRRAASLGNTSGMIFLGFAYREGQGVEKDYKEALRWFKAAYEGGDSFAIDKIGTMYAGYMEPSQEAVDFFLEIAENGEAESCYYLGRLFNNPEASFYNPEKAVDWLIKAVQRGTRMASRALLQLAYHCFEGSGTSWDLEGARIWLDQFFLHAREKTEIHSEAMTLLQEIEKSEAGHKTS